jgi:hypothetical protein
LTPSMHFDNNIPKTTFYTGIFYGLIGLLLWPVFSLESILTHDGAAHVYNSCLIREMVTGNSLYSEFVQLKKFPEPNWIGHFILSVTGGFVSPVAAEKIFIGALIIFLPFFFRKTAKIVSGNFSSVSFLVFPFVYSYFLFGGLYNFIAGVAVFFAALYTTLPKLESMNRKSYFGLFAFSLILYFSHLVVYGVFLILIAMALVFIVASKSNTDYSGFLKNLIKMSVPIVLVLLPSLILLSVFMTDKLVGQNATSSVKFAELIDALIYISPIITLQYSPENIYSLIIFILFIALFVTGIILKIRSKTPLSAPKIFYKRPLYWISASVLMLALFFFLPDQAASGGVLKFRFEFFFFLFLALAVSTLPFLKFTKPVLVLLISFWVVFKFTYLFPKMKLLSKDVASVLRFTETMEENSILLPLNYSPNWMHCNVLNYAGTVKGILVLDNYEAGMPHFPLEWKKDRNPVVLMGNFNISPPPLCADADFFEKKTGHIIDYVVVWNYSSLEDTCTMNIQKMLAERYYLVYNEQELVKLYKRNP